MNKREQYTCVTLAFLAVLIASLGYMCIKHVSCVPYVHYAEKGNVNECMRAPIFEYEVK